MWGLTSYKFTLYIIIFELRVMNLEKIIFWYHWSSITSVIIFEFFGLRAMNYILVLLVMNYIHLILVLLIKYYIIIK